VADYRIGVADVVEVRVDKAQELSGSFRVTSNGTFEMYYLGRIVALNKTPEELATEIADGLRGRYLTAPRVAVEVKQLNSRIVFVQGAVRSPGAYQLDGRVSLLKLISLCGGLAENHGSSAFIFREANAAARAAREAASADNAEPPEYTFMPVNINGLLRGNLSENLIIEPHDIVNIPPADVFFVAGEVRAPGSFPLKPGTTLRQAISLAQGTSIQAAKDRTMIFREDSTGKRIDIKVDVGAIMEGKEEDLAIKANDVIIVPNSKLKSVGATLLRSLGLSAGQVLRY
jgi:polysaccharide export outer membrane protein